MNLPLYQVDAFAERVFTGNPAAVVPLERWPEDALLLAIAAENNLSETAYCVPNERGYELRWFTPTTEVELCGHATLACGFIAFSELGHAGDTVRFATRAAGELVVGRRASGELTLDLPRVPSDPVEAPKDLASALGGAPIEVRLGRAPVADLVAVFAHENDVRALTPDMAAVARLDARGVIATAPGASTDVDVVSRFFGPAVGVDEDPFTGSAHSLLGDLWSERLGRTTLTARQLSARGGAATVEVGTERVTLVGRAVLYLRGEIEVGSGDVDLASALRRSR